jgi:putative Mn2+ efflux pump MntP
MFALGVIGASLSIDAFAAAIGKGAASRQPRFIDALRIGSIFGLFEALTPAIGWSIGLAFASWIQAVDHWVAFTLLALVGGNMLWRAARTESAPESVQAPAKSGMVGLCLTALATSIDAMAVGVSLALLNVDILTACLVIGSVTTVVATAGVLIGRHAGPYLGRWAELIGGVALIAIGALILYQHLSGQA